ncbi:MAG: hypothetical protein ACO323_06200 [Candidatus Kapaibacteriota bacterium]
MFRYTPIIALFLCAHIGVFAQGGMRKNKKGKDTVDVSVKKPYLDLHYGNAEISREGMKGDISNAEVYGISIGLKKEKTHEESDDIIVQDKNGLNLTIGAAKDLQNSDSTFQGIPLAESNALDFWSIGAINGTGYGYNFGGTTLMLGVEDNGTWTSFNPRSFARPLDPADNQFILDMDGTMRFGSAMNSTIEFRVANTVTITGGYTWNQVLPRHMFWYWFGSEVIEGLAGAVVDNVIENFAKVSPKSLPVMHFVLKSALLYGVKVLRTPKMNMPFDTVSPMNITYWNIGVGLTL